MLLPQHCFGYEKKSKEDVVTGSSETWMLDKRSLREMVQNLSQSLGQLRMTLPQLTDRNSSFLHTWLSDSFRRNSVEQRRTRDKHRTSVSLLNASTENGWNTDATLAVFGLMPNRDNRG